MKDKLSQPKVNPEAIRVFTDFLETELALVKFNINIKQSYKKTIKSMSKNDSPKDFIISAFDWAETPQGYGYWDTLDKKYRKYLKELK